MPPTPNATLKGPFGVLLIVQAGVAAGDLWRFQVFARHGGAAWLAADQILRGAAEDGAAVQAIRALYVNRWGHLSGLAPGELVARLRADLADGMMFAAFYIPSPDFTRFAVTGKPDVSHLLADPAGAPIAWSPAQRIAAMLRRVPGYLPDAMRAEVAALFTPRAIALLALMLAALAVAQFYGVGEIVDTILVGIAWATAGWAGLVALKHFIGAVIDAARATALPPIEADAKAAADALVVLGISFLTAVLLRARDQENVLAKDEGPAAEQAPPPKKTPAPVAKGWKDYAASKGVDTSKAVFRGDSRPPSTVFQQGFQPKGTSTDLLDYAKNNTPSTFVSTSTDETVGAQFAQESAQDRGSGYMYVVSPSADGIDVNQTLGSASPYSYENEIAFPGGIPGSDILGAQQIGPDGSTIGPFIPNPGFSGR